MDLTDQCQMWAQYPSTVGPTEAFSMNIERALTVNDDIITTHSISVSCTIRVLFHLPPKLACCTSNPFSTGKCMEWGVDWNVYHLPSHQHGQVTQTVPITGQIDLNYHSIKRFFLYHCQFACHRSREKGEFVHVYQ